MSGLGFEPWEPEETIGKIWHSFASRLDAPESHEHAAVTLSEIEGRLAVFFRGAGGDRSVALKPAASELSEHRLSWRRRLGATEERVPRSSFDGDALRLPDRLDVFPDREINASLYFWLTACAAHAPAPEQAEDPLVADILSLRAAERMTRATLADCPGLAPLHEGLRNACRAARPDRALPKWEAAMERAILTLLGDEAPEDGPAAEILAAIRAQDESPAQFAAPRGYRPFLPVPLWPDLRPLMRSERSEKSDEGAETAGPPEEGKEGVKRARRRKADLAERRDSLILHKFEAILSWAEFLNINRRIDDDDPDNAKKMLDDQDEIALGQVSKAPATRLKLHLDLSPEDVDRERLSGEHLYPEWDATTNAYLPDHCRVLTSDVEPDEAAGTEARDPKAQRRIRAVKRQFEALRPRRVILPAQPDGDDLDLEAAVRSEVELRATGRGSNRIWRAARTEARDLAVSILLDISRSTESAVTGRAVIDIEREALTALAWGLEACGDDCAINAFSSLRRDRVYLRRCKRFDEKMSREVEARIASLRPGHYTRLGAAIRHASAELSRQTRQRRLMLVITDGKPNDLDHYEGRHGIEDCRMAVREARSAGNATFGITIDAKGKEWFSRIFGRGGYALIPHPEKLTAALPQIYRHLVSA